jgi:hypothetical protein
VIRRIIITIISLPIKLNNWIISENTSHREVPTCRIGFGGPPETRTPDPLIKSQLLYQLS